MLCLIINDMKTDPDDEEQAPEPEKCDHEYVRRQCVKCGDSANEDTKDYYER